MPIPLFHSLLAPLIERGVLLANHVLRAQPAATERLVPYAGRPVMVAWRSAVDGWPTPPSVHLRVTPAGLLEHIDGAVVGNGVEGTGLRVSVELPALHRVPGMALAGERPRVDVEGDAQFAADIAWLADSLRWDVEHDVARVFGDMPARFLAQAVGAAAQGVRALARGIGDTWERRPGAGAASAR